MCTCHSSGKHYPGISDRVRAPAPGLVSGLGTDESWVDLSVCVIDTETTGFSPVEDRVIEVGICVAKYGHIKSRHRFLVNPGIPIPAESSRVHGIYNRDVQDKPGFEAIAPLVSAMMRGAIPCAYNATFDRSFILGEYVRCGFDPPFEDASIWLDPLVWARELLPGQRSKKLREVALTLGIIGGTDHTAESDAVMTANIMYAASKLKDLNGPKVPTTYGALISWQRELKFRQQDTMRYWR